MVLVVAIAGVSMSGKSTLASTIKKLYDHLKVQVLGMDQFVLPETKISKKLCSVFKLLLNGISNRELLLGQKIFDHSEKLGKYITNNRGSMIQNLVSNDGKKRIIGGQQVQRN